MGTCAHDLDGKLKEGLRLIRLEMLQVQAVSAYTENGTNMRLTHMFSSTMEDTSI